MKKAFFLGAALLLIGAGCSTTANITTTPSKPAEQPPVQTQTTEEDTDTTTETNAQPTDSKTSDDGKGNKNGVNVELNANINADVRAPKTVEFTITGKNIAYDLKEMKVKKGDNVKVTFVNSEGFHDWVLDGYNVGTKQIGVGKSETIEFTADKVGTFEYFCSVGKHRAMGMKGNFIVE